MKSIELLKAVITMWYTAITEKCEEYTLFGKILVSTLFTLMTVAIFVGVLILVILEAVILVPIWFIVNICHKKKFRLSYKEFFEEKFMR